MIFATRRKHCGSYITTTAILNNTIIIIIHAAVS